MSSIEAIQKDYENMIGFTPPKIQKRLEVSAKVDPKTLDIVEQWRLNALTPESLDPKTVQLISIAILFVQKSAAAKNHMYAAIKAGATIEEVHACAAIANLFSGIAAFNHAGEIIAEVFQV